MRAIISLVLLSAVAQAAAFVQVATCNTQGAPAATCTISLPGTVAGNAIVVAQVGGPVTPSYNLPPTFAGVTCWPLRLFDVDQTVFTNSVYMSSWVCPNIPGGAASITVNGAWSAATNSFTAYGVEISGLGTYPAFDGAPSSWPVYGYGGGGFGSGNSSSLSATATTTSGAFVLAFGGQQATSAGTTCTAGSGFTVPAGGTVTGTNALACLEYNASSAGGSTTAALTVNASKPWGFSMVSLLNGSTPYSGSGTQPFNGQFVAKGTVTAVPSHSAATITEAFPTMAVLPNGNIGMAYEQNSPNQGSGPNSAAAFRFSSNGGSLWSDFSGTNFGTDCSGHPWFNGCLFSGDGTNSNSHWFPGYNGLMVNGSTTYYTVTVEDNVGNCVHAYLSKSTDSGVTWSNPTSIELSTTACWIAPLVFVPGGGVSSNCPSGCILGFVQQNNGTNLMLTSTDGGNTWPASTTIPTAALFLNQLETFIWWNSGNQLVGVARSITGQPLRTFQSTDLGSTWNGSYSNLVPITGSLNAGWVLTSPVVLFPNLGDGNVSVLYGDRQTASIRLSSASINTLLNSSRSLNQGEIFTTITATNTFGYPTAVNTSGANWLFAWYAPNGSNNGQIFTMQGTYVPSGVAPKLIP